MEQNIINILNITKVLLDYGGKVFEKINDNFYNILLPSKWPILMSLALFALVLSFVITVTLANSKIFSNINIIRDKFGNGIIFFKKDSLDPKDPKDPEDPKDPKDPKDPEDPKGFLAWLCNFVLENRSTIITVLLGSVIVIGGGYLIYNYTDISKSLKGIAGGTSAIIPDISATTGVNSSTNTTTAMLHYFNLLDITSENKEVILVNFNKLYAGIKDPNVINMYSITPESFVLDREFLKFVLDHYPLSIKREAVDIIGEMCKGKFNEQNFLETKPHLCEVFNELLLFTQELNSK